MFYNSSNVKEYFPYTKDMIEKKIKPTANEIWKYGVEKSGIKLREINVDYLEKILLPRIKGVFSRKGLKVKKLYYFNPDYTEEYLTGGEVEVAYSPECVDKVWLIEDMKFIEFSIIQKRYQGMDYDLVELLKHQQNELIGGYKQEELQKSIELIEHIQVITRQGDRSVKEIKNIRENRAKERRNMHKVKGNE